MSQKQILDTALHDAMKANDEARKRSIRMVLANIKLAEVETGKPLDDNGIFAIIQKEIKSRIEAIADAKQANRPDLIVAAEAEIKILEGFLPRQLSQSELVDLIQAVIRELSASGPKDMGKVIKEVMIRVEGRASGNAVSQTVRAQLESK